MSNKGLLRAVKTDKVQTLFIEFGFREAYQTIKQFATLGCEVTLLSGSCPKQLVLPLMRSLRLFPVTSLRVKFALFAVRT